MSENADTSEHSPTSSLKWSDNIDKMLAGWCDNAKCFEWMHLESFDLNFKRSRKFMIAINLLTAISGLSNVIIGGYSINGFQVSWIFGAISISVSTLNLLQDKLGYQQVAEQHRKFANQWSIIRNKIEEIILIPPDARKDCATFLKYIKVDINQASTGGNSLIPQSIRNACFAKFKDIPDFDIPDICGQMEHTKIYVDINKPLLMDINIIN